MNYLQLVNAVMRRLREDDVNSVSQSSYSKLIGDFVNEAKREVEDSWNWTQLRTTIQVPTVSGTYAYTLTGAGKRFKILQVVCDTEDYELLKAPYKWMNVQLTSNTTQQAQPNYWDINGESGGNPNVNLWPIPNDAYTLNFNMFVPQDDLSADDDELTLFHHPVILGAYAKALSERGEDGGTQFAEAFASYNKALSEYISSDAYHYPAELQWEVD